MIVGHSHSYGLDWWEQTKDVGGARRWKKHPIDPFNSQYHDLIWADIDNDGKPELITGKRYRAHCGRDPGEMDDLGIYYFKWTGEGFAKQVIAYGPPGVGAGCGIEFQVADLRKTGRLDIVAPGKDGLHVFFNEEEVNSMAAGADSFRVCRVRVCRARSIHIPNFRSLPQCNFMALAEVRTEIGKKVQARYGIPKLYKSHEEIAADPDIQAVGVSAAFALQGKIAEDLIRAGKHVFMEKPMAVSVARARQMVAAVEGGKARLMVGYMKRYDPGNIALKKHLTAWRESGDRGKILYARNHGFGGNWVYAGDPNVPVDYSQEAYPPIPDQAPDWLPPQYKNSYLGYLQQWTHNINLLRFLLDGDKPSAVKVKSVQLDPDGMTGVVVLEINGTRAVVEEPRIRGSTAGKNTRRSISKAAGSARPRRP